MRTHLLRAIDEDAEFATWADQPMHLAFYELRSPESRPTSRPTILEMLALRRTAHLITEGTQMLLMSLIPVVAGRIAPSRARTAVGHLKLIVSMVGPTRREAEHVVEGVLSQVRGILPPGFQIRASLVERESWRPPSALAD